MHSHKLRNTALTVVLITALLGLTAGCELPDYQMEFEISSVQISGSDTIVNCSLSNIGREKLKDAQVQVKCVSGAGFGQEEWTDPVTLSVDESRTVSATFIGINNGLEANFQIGAAGWNTDD